MHFRSFFYYFDRYVFPPFCQSCRVFLSENRPFCAECTVRLKRPLTQDYKLSSGKTVTLYAAAAYADEVRRLVCAKQYKQVAAAHLLGILALELAPCPWREFDFLLPVPLHWTRFYWRGFNQALIIAQEIEKGTECPVIQPLYRYKKTRYQATLSADLREQNVCAAFAFKNLEAQKQCVGKSILLVDDVITTGATVASIAQLLYRAGASRVACVAAARAFYS